MFIQTEDTPNPNTIKFLFEDLLLSEDSVSLTRGSKELNAFPVASHLFELEDVNGVFICNSFISVTKEETADWESLKTLIFSQLLDLTSQNLPLVNQTLFEKIRKEDSQKEESGESTKDSVQSSIVIQIKELIETRVRPAVAKDGGDIVYKSFKEGVVYLELRGACSGCPSATITLKNGIENMLKHYIPEVQSVEAV